MAPKEGHPVIDLTALRKACELATPGKWFARNRFLSLVANNSGMGATLPTNHLGVLREADDAAFVAMARTAMPELLDRVVALEAEVARMRPVYEASIALRFYDIHPATERQRNLAMIRWWDAIDAAKGEP